MHDRLRALRRGDVNVQIDVQETTELGDLIAAAFDEAARLSNDAEEVSRLATQALARLLGRARRAPRRRAVPPAFLSSARDAHQGDN